MGSETIRLIRDEHAAISAVLRSMSMLLDLGPGGDSDRFFAALRAMLFYIDEFPERLHHPRESDLLFPSLARAAPQLMPVIRRLENDHMQGEGRVRQLQHALTAWELLGEARGQEFMQGAREYIAFYLDHMHTEEAQLLPEAGKLLSPRQWKEIDTIFCAGHEDWAGMNGDPAFDKLFTRIVLAAPAPIGVGPSLEAADAR